MDKQFYNISYTGLDKERIDLQHYIRGQGHKPDSIYLDIDRLSKSNRDIEKDFESVGGQLEQGKFVDIGEFPI